MFKEAFQNFSDAYLTIGGLLIFVLFFSGVLVFALSKNRKNFFSEMEKLPLELTNNQKELV